MNRYPDGQVIKNRASRSLSTASLVFVLPAVVLLFPLGAHAQKFYPDDPLTKEPPPFQTENVNYRALSEIYEIATNTFTHPGERQPRNGVIPAQGINTLGEVMDGPWFVNRHARIQLSIEELMRGPGDSNPPSRKAPWRVLTVRKYGIRPGLLIHDADNNLCLLRFDPPGHLEMSTGAARIGSRLYHALGYWVPEHYLVYFDRSQLVADPEGEDINAVGNAEHLSDKDINLFLEKVSRDPVRGYRAIAIKAPKGAKLVGPYQFFGTRSDDPNDIVPHEHRRDLRGLYVISAWVNNNWIGLVQNQDTLIQENGVFYIRHNIMDFSTLLGSGLEQIKNARDGNEPLFDLRVTTKNFTSLGITGPPWQRADYPDTRSVGLFEYEVFDPTQWQPSFEVAALANHLPDDDYWAAKQILAFSDDDLRAIVKTGQYSDPKAEEWIAKCLIERRKKIGQHFLDRVLPLENFRVEGGQLHFEDLAVKYGFRPARDYSVEWSEFRNLQGDHLALRSQRSFHVPERAMSSEAGSYFAAKISGPEPGKTLTLYLRKEKSGFKVAGIDRDWPGKVVAQQNQQPAGRESRYGELTSHQKELFDQWAANYNQKTGFNLSNEEIYLSLSISERTTFDAVTHALSKSTLTEKNGNSLGTALDLLQGIERIAGQYYGRQGDEQFRLYCNLRPNAKEILEKSQEFRFGEENTVYHAGYPDSYRQTGKEPSIQFSMSSDGLKADIDVDYRSSKLPQAFWSGHLTSANSDVRAGDNYQLHNNRWAGLVNWWSQLFAKFSEQEQQDKTDLIAKEPSETPTPLPPDRPPGAAIANVQDAVQEFLTDWLVRRKIDEAMDLVSDRALACLKTTDAGNGEAATPQQTRQKLEEMMKAITDRYGKKENLTEVIDAVIPWRKAFQVVKQPFEGDFTIVEVPDAYAKVTFCESQSKEAQEQALAEASQQYGNYYGAVFRFKGRADKGGIIGLLWTRENGAWRLVSWQVFEP